MGEAEEFGMPGYGGNAYGYDALAAVEKERLKMRQSISDYVVSLEHRIIELEIRVKHLLGAGYISGKIKDKMNAELKRLVP